ncbi:MAG: response regulator [Mucilaginibacter sp.]|nr:response regulator [Mucilaginibacter sp.]
MKRILLIEDDFDVRDVIKSILRLHDFEVFELEKTDDVVAVVIDLKPDLVVTDFLLFGLNGGKICKDLKTDHRTRHIPVVLITGFKDFAFAFGAYGFDGFIEKPFEINELLETINKCLVPK